MHMTTERIPITDREQWLGLRKQDVTASVVGALFGIDPWQTIAGVHAEKMGLDLPGPNPESAVIRRGNALEPVVATEVAKLRPEWRLIKNTEYLRDPRARIGATPDFWIENDPRGRGVLQAKTVGSWKFEKEWACGEEWEPPRWIFLQVLTEMMLADAAFGAIGVLALGDFVFDTHIIEVPRHKQMEHKIRVAVHAFWQALDAGQAPTLDYERDGDLVKLMYPAAVPGKVIDLRGDNRIIELLETRELQAGFEKEAKMRKETAETEIREKIGDAELAIVPGWRVSLGKTRTIAAHFVDESKPFRTLRCSRHA
jgi:predicted phage-related endonuclease